MPSIFFCFWDDIQLFLKLMHRYPSETGGKESLFNSGLEAMEMVPSYGGMTIENRMHGVAHPQNIKVNIISSRLE
jgi:hypothetical protein